MATPGKAIFSNLPIIFGIGVAFGFARENRGEVALVGAIAYFVLILLAQVDGSLTTLFYSNVNLGDGLTKFYDADGNIIGAVQGSHSIGTTTGADHSKFFSDVLYLNILAKGSGAAKNNITTT